ncbi:S-layer homology domain-containing protein [Pseudobacillus sp. FSL P4-0506]|uniref:S-layer homology domain-containing protein n=1 Tax=Pseudobacillus sp. FSL P4-0506 TaxID=2921576 RepID=UPI0030F5CE86
MKKVSKFIITSFLGASLALTPITESMLNVLDNSQIAQAATIQKKFKDVSDNSYAFEAINELTKRGIISGYHDGSFKPEGTVTRGQFAAFLARYLNLPNADSKFKDLPKSAALYKEVSRAAKVGIIKGDTKGYVKAADKVSRADIAIMIDRAMQLKGKYNETTELSFKDNGSIPAYAMESVKKMTKYGIIQGKGNNTFAPTEYADRAVSAVFVHRMVSVIEGKMDTSNPEKPSTGDKPDYHSWSYEKMVQEIGLHTLLLRDWATGEIKEYNVTKYVYDVYQEQTPDKTQPHPSERLKTRLEGLSYNDSAMYPQGEIIAYNGKALKDSAIWSDERVAAYPSRQQVGEVMPTHPKQNGQFLIDVYTFRPDFVTFKKDKLELGNLGETPVPHNDNDYIMNLKGLFAQASGVKVVNGGAEISYGQNKITLKNGSKTMIVNGKQTELTAPATVKNGQYYAPVREVAAALGLSTRKVVQGVGYYKYDRATDKINFGYKLEIANFDLPLKAGVWK